MRLSVRLTDILSIFCPTVDNNQQDTLVLVVDGLPGVYCLLAEVLKNILYLHQLSDHPISELKDHTEVCHAYIVIILTCSN